MATTVVTRIKEYSSAFPNGFKDHNNVTLKDGSRLIPLDLVESDYQIGLSAIGYIIPPVHEILLGLVRELKVPMVEYCPENGGHWCLNDCIIGMDTDEVTALMQAFGRELITRTQAAGIGHGWRTEPVAIYADIESKLFENKRDKGMVGQEGNRAFNFARGAARMLGMSYQGAILNVYEGAGTDLKIWVATSGRDRDILDLAAGGGLQAGSTPREGVAKEAFEEALLPEDFVRSNARFSRIISFANYLRDGIIFPIHSYLFELKLDPTSSTYQPPRPDNDEVLAFRLMSAQEILQLMRDPTEKICRRALTAWCSLLIREGHIDEGDPEYAGLREAMEREYPVAAPMVPDDWVR